MKLGCPLRSVWLLSHENGESLFIKFILGIKQITQQRSFSSDNSVSPITKEFTFKPVLLLQLLVSTSTVKKAYRGGNIKSCIYYNTSQTSPF